ncbi:MAG: DUF58 domain-containing protein [Clostridiales bacterium]|nr:DUF58 domain-containing protein [Clostridiales bacterium]
MDLNIERPVKTKPGAYRKDKRVRRRRVKNLERRRKIRLTVTCAVLLAVSVVPAVFVNTVIGYLPVFMVGLLIALSFIYLQCLRRALVFEEKSEFNNCRRGTASAFSIRVKNRSPLVYPKLEVFFYISDLFGGEDDITSTTITLSPFEDRIFEFNVQFEHIGTYEAGLNKVVIQDLFGFFQKTLPNTSRYEIQVAPKVYDLARLNISNRAFSESRNMLKPTSMDGTDYTGVREYVIGDPIKNIHWKLSARTEHYMTRQFESYGNMGVSILMDFQCPSWDRDSMMSVFDGVVETALSAEAYARRNGMEAELLYLNKNGGRRRYISRNDEGHAELVADVPKITAEKLQKSALQLLREEGNAAYSKSNLAFITGNVTPQLPRTLMDIKARRKNPILFVVLPNILTGEERQKYLKPLRGLDYAGIPYYVIGEAQELMGGERRVS